MSLESEPAASEPTPAHRGRLLNDPLVIRALAHPLRIDLLAVIGRSGQATTAEAARELGISHGLASHHLRQLAKYGFIEQVAGKDNRERPWRQAADSYHWPDSQSDPETAAATDVFEQVLAERVLEGFLRWQEQRRDWPAEWLAGAGLSTTTVYLTPAELSELTAEFDVVFRRWVETRPIGDAANRPAGSKPVDLSYFAVPTGAAPAQPAVPPAPTVSLVPTAPAPSAAPTPPTVPPVPPAPTALPAPPARTVQTVPPAPTVPTVPTED